MFFCKGQCDFSTYKDSLCLLSNLFEHVLIAYGPLGSFFSFVILLYILLSCQLQTLRINVQILSQNFLCLGLDFLARTCMLHVKWKLWTEGESQKVRHESCWKALLCWKKYEKDPKQRWLTNKEYLGIIDVKEQIWLTNVKYLRLST